MALWSLGFAVENTSFYDNRAQIGAAFASFNSKGNFTDIYAEGNEALQEAGVFWIFYQSDVIINGLTAISNSAQYDGVLQLNVNSKVEIYDSIF